LGIQREHRPLSEDPALFQSGLVESCLHESGFGPENLEMASIGVAAKEIPEADVVA
jgi:hypothetical protein